MFQRVELIGRLGADPEVRYLPDGTPVANIRIATDESYRNEKGEKIEKTEWHRCVSFGKMASVIGDYLKKGRLIHVEGKLHTRKWDDKDGITRYTTEVQVRGMKMLDFKKEEDSEPCPNEKPTTSNIDADDDVPF